MNIPEVVLLGDIFQTIISYARGMWLHRWPMLGISWFVCLAGWGYVFTMPDLYQASARVAIVNPQTEIIPFLKTFGQGMDVTGAARSVLDQLVSRENLLQVLRETEDLQHITDLKELESQVQRIRQTISILPQRNSTYLFVMKSNDPKLNYQVLKGLMDILVTKGIDGMSASPSTKASGILQEQIEDFQKRMIVAENEMRAFRKKNIDILGEDDTDFYSRLKNLQNLLEREQGTLNELDKKRLEILRQLGEHGGTEVQPDLESSVDLRIQDIQNRIAELKSKYYMKGDVRRPLYSEDHPEILSLRRAMEQIEDQRKRGISLPPPRETRRPEENSRESLDPFVAKLKMSLSDIDVEYASVATRIADFQKRLRSMKALEPGLPSVMSEMEHHKRKITILKEKLSSLMNTQGEADFSGDLAANLSKLVKVQITEQPVVATRSIGPNRPLFYSIVFGAGLAAGLATALILAYLRPVFDSPMHLKQVLGLPVLGMVTRVQSEELTLRFLPSGSFLWLLLLLAAIYGIIMLHVL